jgi:alginate O-acetyltransferase complex protein AlgI
MLLVMVGWVFFRATTWAKAVEFLGAMFGRTEPGWRYLDVSQYVDGAVATWFAVGVLLVFLPLDRLSNGLARVPRVQTAALGLASLVITFLAMLSLSKTQFNPFIYFQF